MDVNGTGALDGLRVVDLSDSTGGAYCAKLLADLGADVMLVEPPGGSALRRRGPFAGESPGPEHSLSFLNLGLNKHGAMLDPETSRGRDALHTLLREADIVVESDAAGCWAERGLGYEQLSTENPPLVWVSVTHFGTDGPYRTWKGTDLIDWAMGGYLYFGGDPGRTPLAVPGPQGEYHAGFLAAGAALAALWQVRRGGPGQRVETSALEALLSAHGWLATMWTHEGQVQRRQGTLLTRCADGWVCVFRWIQSREELLLLTAPELVGDPRFADLAAWREHEAEFRAIVEAWCLRHAALEVERAAQELRIAITAVRDAGGLLGDEQLAARGWWLQAEHPAAGAVTYPGVPYQLAATPARLRRQAPSLAAAAPAGWEQPRAANDAARVAYGRVSNPSLPGSRLPLQDVRVLELTSNWAGPLAARHLADLGADVIKIELARKPATRFLRFPGGVLGKRWWNRAAYFNSLNRNKRGICLDIGTARGRELFLDLVADADVVIENNSVRVLRNLGVEYEMLRAVNRRIILCSISGFGQTGPQQDYSAYGINVEATCGLVSVTGYGPGEPRGTGSFYADPVGGGHAAVAVLAALHARERMGEGQRIDLALNESAAALFAEPLLDAAVNGRVRRQMENRHPDWVQGVYPSFGVDQWLAVALRDEEEWAAFAGVAGEGFARPQWQTNAGRLADQDALDEAIAAWSREREHYDAARALQAAGVPAAPVLANYEILADPHVNARGFYRRWEQPDAGWQTFPGMPWRLSGTPPEVRRPAPGFAEHNAEVFGGLLGLSDAEIAALYADGVSSAEPADTQVPAALAGLTGPV